MQMSQPLTISVVIPAHNEASCIANCLESLLSQTIAPHEIIVVDNNSTDETAAIAKQFPGVRVIKEKRKGVTYARTAGFMVANGDIIARVDADSTMRRDWIENIQASFKDPSVDAIAGAGAIAAFSLPNRFAGQAMYRLFRRWHERSMQIGTILYGYNCAFRRRLWPDMQKTLTLGDNEVSDDIDITLSLRSMGASIQFAPNVVVKCRVFRSFTPEKMSRYYRTDGRTLYKHKAGNYKRWVKD